MTWDPFDNNQPITPSTENPPEVETTSDESNAGNPPVTPLDGQPSDLKDVAEPSVLQEEPQVSQPEFPNTGAAEAAVPQPAATAIPEEARVQGSITPPSSPTGTFVPPIYPGQQSYYYTAPLSPAQKRNKRGIKIFAGVLAAVIIVIGSVSVGFLAGRRSDGANNTSDLLPKQNQTQQNSENPGGTSSFDITTDSNNNNRYAYQDIVAAVSKSVVNITVYSSDGKQGAYASGIIMDAKQGYVLTNDHIYKEIANAKFLITLNDGTEFKADFVSGDSRSDVGILKIENPKNLTAATFNTDPLTVGETVLAIGQSYGYADTVSDGIVSAVDRRVSMQSGTYSERYIQTTAAINPGNSGGALVNMAGQVVGVTVAKISSEDVEGLGFAIPAKRALDIVANLQKNGTVKGRAKLGITYTEMGTVLAEVNNLPTGLLIQSISEDSGLYGKGFQSGDVITQINGKEITLSTMVLDIIEESKAGDTVTLTVYKAKTGQSETVKVALAEAESTTNYSTQKSKTKQDDSQSEGNDLPDNPFEYYFGNPNQ